MQQIEIAREKSANLCGIQLYYENPEEKNKSQYSGTIANGIVRIFLAVGIITMTGCNSQKGNSYDTTHLETPPPKPPNCSDLPDLGQLKLPSGKVADVRIIKVGSSKLFVPLDSLSEYLIDLQPRFQGSVGAASLETFKPDLHSIECPGVEHIFENKRDFFEIRSVRSASKQMKNVELHHDIKRVFFSSSSSRGLGAGETYNIIIPINRDINVMMFSDAASGKKKVVSANSHSVTEFVKWLMTAPSQRDNNQRFILKVDTYD